METNNKARREAAMLVFIVFLLGALLGGVGGHLWDERVLGQQLGQQPAPSKAKPSRDQVVANLTRELQLTSDQQKQLGSVIDDTRSKWQTLYAPLDAPREQIRQEGRANIRAILTPEQQLKYEDFMRRLDEQRKKDAAR